MLGTLLAPPGDDATRWQFLRLTAGAGLLTACGSDTDAAPAARTLAQQTQAVSLYQNLVNHEAVAAARPDLIVSRVVEAEEFAD